MGKPRVLIKGKGKCKKNPLTYRGVVYLKMKEIKEVQIDGKPVKILPSGIRGKEFYGKKANTISDKKRKRKQVLTRKKKKKDNGKLGRFISMVDSNHIGSYGEEKIFTLLKKCNLHVLREVVFEKLNNKRFDFFLPGRNTLIEFDGKQHFEHVEAFDRGDKTRLLQRQQSDREKDNFAKLHKLRLIRISYKETNILEEKLSKLLYK